MSEIFLAVGGQHARLQDFGRLQSRYHLWMVPTDGGAIIGEMCLTQCSNSVSTFMGAAKS